VHGHDIDLLHPGRTPGPLVAVLSEQTAAYLSMRMFEQHALHPVCHRPRRHEKTRAPHQISGPVVS